MPPTLHPCLKRGLDYDASPTDPSDLVEDDHIEVQGLQNETAKRRRVEAIALQYLRGRPPLILTARLKGPFNSKEWNNPWTQKEKWGQAGAGKIKKEQVHRRPQRRSKASQVASPEASRAVGHTEEHFHSQHELEPLPATAPIPDDNEKSGGTEFSSVDTEQFIANDSPLNPFWLRRPATSIVFPSNSQTDKSPSRIRKRDHRYSSRNSLQLAPPKKPLAHQYLPIRATPPDEWRSSASASMDISLTGKPATAIKNQPPQQNSPLSSSTRYLLDSPRLREDSAQEEEARSSQAAQCAQMAAAAETPVSLLDDTTVDPSNAPLPQALCAQSFDSLVPATTYKLRSTVQVPQSSPIRGAAGPARQTALHGEDFHESAEHLIAGVSGSKLNQELLLEMHTIAKESSLPRKQRHDLVASPAPDSSTGFMYRRVGQPKHGTSGIQKAKPRAVSFSSSSPPKTKNKEVFGAALESIATDATAEVLGVVPSAVVADATDGNVVQQREDEMEVQEEEERTDEQQESYKSRQSQYSTQAAMVLAQLEFQEDLTQSSTSSLTLRPWSQPAQSTPPALLPQPSPALTPLSVFNARANVSFSDLAGNSVLDGPPTSTQDLFNAASPFAFSTVKKTSQRPRRTSMRFALASKLNESTTAKSPTPLTERMPLKDKNICTRWSFSHEKSSMTSHKRVSPSPQHITNDVELPQLDLHTSLDFGPNADFTEYFLQGLSNEP